jgi:hypothetical protein
MRERIEQRIDAAIGVVVRVDGRAEPCLSQTISVRGLAITSLKDWPIGTLVGVDLMHQGVRVSTSARVVSRHSSAIGLEFIDNSPELTSSMNALLATLVGGSPTRAEPPDRMRDVVWLQPEERSGIGGFFRGRQHKARLIDVSLDGAAISGKNPPKVGDEIIVRLPNYVADQNNQNDTQKVDCAACVVRHTERGFAVKFVTPSALFRRVISAIRKSARH